MLKLNEAVMYGTTGVCTVVSVEEKKIGKEKRKYYVLKPNSVATSTVFVPADNDLLLSKARELITKDAINGMLAQLKTADSVWVRGDSERKQCFGETVMSGDRMECLKLLKTLIVHQKELSTVGKRLHLADERVLREVQRLLCDEFAFVLGLSVEDAFKLITDSF